MKKKTNLLTSIAACLILVLTGCGNGGASERTAPFIPASDDSSVILPSLTSADGESTTEPVSSSSSAESDSASVSVSDSASASESSSESEEPAISYTAAEAIDAVAELMSAAFGATVSANHDEDGDYIVVNLGESPADTVKSYCDMYFVPEGFDPAGDWASDQFQDGMPVEYADWVCGGVGLEYLVYEVSGYEGDQEGFNGVYLQIVAFDLPTAEE